MCGIAGFLGAPSHEAAYLEELALTMARRLSHRGPDDEGAWVDPACGVALAHRRLSILDLSAAGHQPMVSPSGRYVLSYNGELYNFRTLRDELSAQGVGFHSRTDTEVFLAGFDVWGCEGTLERANGMFAFAVWDRRDRTITVARDRLGEKPLFYARADGTFVFASELTSLRAHPEVSGAVDREALAAFLRYGYVPAPMSILEGVRKLPAGHVLTTSLEADQLPRPRCYWRPGLSAPVQFPSEADAAEALHERLRSAVRLRLESDVPLGAFLSGGVDSSTVAALAQEVGSTRLRTFSVGFEEKTLDESDVAAAVAQHLGTEHTEVRVTFSEALATAPRLGAIFDEPFADPSQIPTVLLSAAARQHVTVALSGDGGDELFGGYGRYVWEQRIWRASTAVPSLLKRLAPPAAQLLPQTIIDGVRLERTGAEAKPPLSERLQRAAGLLSAPNRPALYERMMARWDEPPLVDGRTVVNPAFFDPHVRRGEVDSMAQLSRVDLETYLPDDILVKVDRASMNVGLETRIPLLDPSVVMLALGMPSALKFQSGVSKLPLRAVLSHYLPRDLVERPKRAFTVPLAAWLRGPLRDWAGDLLDSTQMQQDGYLDVARVRRHWQDHLSGRHDRHLRIWTVLMFQAWLRTASRTPALSRTSLPAQA